MMSDGSVELIMMIIIIIPLPRIMMIYYSAYHVHIVAFRFLNLLKYNSKISKV